MSRESLLVLIGILVVLSPFVGLPLTWLAVLVPVLGGMVALIGVTLVSRKGKKSISAHEAIALDNA